MKTRRMLLLLLSAFLFHMLIGCGSQEPEDIIKDTVEELMDAQNEAIREEALADRTYDEDDDSVEIFSSKWPKEIPKEFVEFEYGTHLQTVLHLEEDGNWTIIYAATRD